VFPKLGTYASFDNRLNLLAEAFKQLAATLLKENQPQDALPKWLPGWLIKWGARVKKGICYHGLKLHAL